MPGENRCDRGDYARMLVLFCMRGCGRIERPAFPAPSDLQKAGRSWQTSRETCGEIAKLCLASLRGAKRRSNPSFPVAPWIASRSLSSRAGVAQHVVAAGDEAGGGRKWDAAGVFEALAGREPRLLADYAFATDLLLAAGGGGNDPVPRPQLHRLLAGIGDDDGVGPEILTFFDRRAFRQEVRFDGDLDLAGNGAVHAGDSFQIVRHHSEKFRRNQIALAALTASISLGF